MQAPIGQELDESETSFPILQFLRVLIKVRNRFSGARNWNPLSVLTSTVVKVAISQILILLILLVLKVFKIIRFSERKGLQHKNVCLSVQPIRKQHPSDSTVCHVCS
jgi:hypothetical protein